MARASKSKVDALVDEIERLTPEERTELRRRISSLERDAGAKKPYGATELRGLGKEFWRGIDVERYVREERASWGD